MAALSADGKRLLMGFQSDLPGADDGTLPLVKLYDVETGKEIRSFADHKRAVGDVAFLPDGKKIITGTTWGPYKLWEVETGKEIGAFGGEGRKFRAGGLSPDGKTFVTLEFGKDGGMFKVWDAETGKRREEFTIEAVVDAISLTVSPDGKYALVGTHPVAGKQNLALQIVDIPARRLVCPFPFHPSKERPEGWRQVAVFTADSKSLIAGMSEYDENLKWKGKTFLVRYDIGNEKRAQKLERPLPDDKRNLFLEYMAISPDGEKVLTMDSDGRLRLTDLSRGTQLWSGPVRCWNPTFVAVGKQILLLSDHPTGNTQSLLPPGQPARKKGRVQFQLRDAKDGHLIREWPEADK